jgi:hypothetical protein
MKTSRVRELLPDYVRGKLDPASRTEIDSAIEKDSGLKNDCENLKKYYHSISYLSPLKAPPGFARAVADHIEAKHRKKSVAEILFKPFSIKVTLEVAGVLATAALIIAIYHPFPFPVEKQQFAEKSMPAQEMENAPAPASVQAPKAVDRLALSAESNPKARSAAKAREVSPQSSRLSMSQPGSTSAAGALIADNPHAANPEPFASDTEEQAELAYAAKIEHPHPAEDRLAMATAEQAPAAATRAPSREQADKQIEYAKSSTESLQAISSPVQLSLAMESQDAQSDEKEMAVEKKDFDGISRAKNKAMAEPAKDKIENAIRRLKGRITEIEPDKPQHGQTRYTFGLPSPSYDSLVSHLSEMGKLTADLDRKSFSNQSFLTIILIVQNPK